MSAPKRVQMRRTKGWRKPKGVIVCTRPGRYGNPYRVKAFRRAGWMLNEPQWVYCVVDANGERCSQWGTKAQATADAVALFRHGADLTEDEIARLRGRDLGCTCPLDQPCHTDVLLEWANRPAGETTP